MTVAVIVHECTSGSPSRGTRFQQTGLLGHICESSITVIFVKPIVTKISTENIFEAIVVVVANTNSVRPAGRRQSRFLCHVGERAIAIVLIEAVRCFRRITFQAGSGEDKNVHPSVIVVVDEGAPASVRLHDVFLRLHPAVNDRSVQARLPRYIGELRVEGTT